MTHYGELHQLASEEPADIKAKACVQTAIQQQANSSSTPSSHSKCSNKPIDQGTHITHKNIPDSNDYSINDSFATCDDLVTIQHGLAIATNTQLAHNEDERSVSSSLQMEPILDPADVSKSNTSIETFSTKPTLDDTFYSLETFNSAIFFEGFKGAKLPMPPELFMASGFDLSIDNCIGASMPGFADYGKCDQFDETMGLGFWERH